MFRRLLFCSTLLGLVLTSANCPAQVGRSGLISRSAAGRYGLKRSWHTQIPLDGSRSRVESVLTHVSNSQFQTIYEVVHAVGRFSFGERDLDRLGKPIGEAGAKERAERKLKQLRAARLKPQLVTKRIPEITLYVQTSSGFLHALDGETGRILWSTAVGDRNRPSMRPAASDKYVAAVNGSHLYILDQTDGSLRWRTRLSASPGAGPGLSQSMVFVPLFRGAIESYSLEGDHRPRTFGSVGRALIQPTVTANSVSWSTDSGYLYVGYAESTAVRYRTEIKETLVARSAFQGPNRLFMTSLDGYVYALEETTGDILWRYSIGEPISQPPIIIGDAVYIVADRGGLLRLSVETGERQWRSPQVRQFAASSSERIYATDAFDRLLIIDAKTGVPIDAMATARLETALANWQTDRIYLISKSGLIQSLHETQADVPLIHVVPSEVKTTEDVKKPDSGDQPAPATAADEAADVFGDDPDADDGADDEPLDDDPDADPFGGDDDDPFGGEDDS